MVTPFSFFNMVEAFQKPGCAICNMLQDDNDEFVKSLLYEYPNDINVQETFRAARGLCNEHSWQLLSYKGGGALSIAVLYATTVRKILKIIDESSLEKGGGSWLNRLRGGADPGSALADQLESGAHCLACDVLRKSEDHYLETFSQYIDDQRLQEVYRASEGLCLPHFRLALRVTRDPERLQQLVSIQAEIWRAIEDELETFKDNYDITKAQVMGEEGDSWQRVIGQMAGRRGIFGLFPRRKT
jgi:hypothetical protein